MDLRPNSKYTLLVYATNLKGRSQAVVLKAPLSTKYEKQTHRKFPIPFHIIIVKLIIFSFHSRPLSFFKESSSTDEEDNDFVLFNPLITIVISCGTILTLSFVSILICMVRIKSRNSDAGSDSDGRKSSSNNHKSSPSQSYESNGGLGGENYVTTEDGLLLKTLNEGRDRTHGSHHHAAYSVVGCKSPIGDTLKVVTESELDHELVKDCNTPGSGGYHTLSTSRVYCEEGRTRYSSVGPVIDYRPHYEYSLGTLGRTSDTLDSRQSMQFHVHPQNLTPQHVVSSTVSSESAYDSPRTFFAQVSYEVSPILTGHVITFSSVVWVELLRSPARGSWRKRWWRRRGRWERRKHRKRSSFGCEQCS